MKAIWAVYRDLLSLLPTGAQRFLTTYAVLLSLLAVLDAASLALLAVVIGPMINNDPLTLPLVGTIEGLGLFVILGVVCLLVVAKGLFALLLMWIATRRLARYELEIGSRMFSSYIGSPWVDRLKRNSSDLIRLTDSGIAQTVAGFLLPGASMLS